MVSLFKEILNSFKLSHMGILWDNYQLDPWGKAEWAIDPSPTEKAIIKLANASWRNIYLGKKTKKNRRIWLLDNY